MKTELLIANKRSGKIWECSNCVTTCSWETNRTGSPGKFTFTLIKAGDIDFLEGDIVRFKVDGQLQFYGWVLQKKKTAGELSTSRAMTGSGISRPMQAMRSTTRRRRTSSGRLLAISRSTPET